MRTALLLVLATACGSGGPTHWSEQPLEAQEGTNEGVTFTIQLPKGMKKSSVESKYDVEFSYHVDGRVYAPNVSVSKAARKQTLADAIKGESQVKAPTDVVFQQETGDFWVYALENSSYKGREDYVVRSQKTIGDVTLSCNARVYPMKKGGKAKQDIPTVAKLCQSLAVK